MNERSNRSSLSHQWWTARLCCGGLLLAAYLWAIPAAAEPHVVVSGISTIGRGHFCNMVDSSSKSEVLACIPIDPPPIIIPSTDPGHRDRKELVIRALPWDKGMCDVAVLLFVGGNDAICGTHDSWVLLQEGRRRGAPWCYVYRPGAGHVQVGDKAKELRDEWLNALKQLKRPIDLSTGWLGILEVSPTGKHGRFGEEQEIFSIVSAKIVAYKDYRGEMLKTSWFPNQSIAQKWADLATSGGTVSDIRPRLTGVEAFKTYHSKGPDGKVTLSLKAELGQGVKFSSVVFQFQQLRGRTAIHECKELPYEFNWSVPDSFPHVKEGTARISLYVRGIDEKGRSTVSEWIPIYVSGRTQEKAAPPIRKDQP